MLPRLTCTTSQHLRHCPHRLRQTNGLPPPRPVPPTRDLESQRVPGTCAACVGGLRRGAAPSTRAHCGRGLPSARTDETNVVSMANRAPPNNRNPSATTSKRRASWLAMGRSKSLTKRLVETRAPASRQTREEAQERRRSHADCAVKNHPMVFDRRLKP